MRKITPEEVYESAAHQTLVLAPPAVMNPRTVCACEKLYEQYVRPASGEMVPEHAFLDLSRWVFLEYLVRFRGVLARGANEPDLDPVGPGLPSRNILGWDRPCYYAYASGLQAIFFAILDRQRLRKLSVFPFASALHVPGSPDGVIDSGGTRDLRHGDRFHFAVDYRALSHAPWRRGTVYLLPRARFAPQYREAIWFSSEVVRPLARLRVSPADWPLLDRVLGMDAEALEHRSDTEIAGWPWGDDGRLYPHRRFRPLALQTRDYLDAHFAESVSLADLGARAGVSAHKLLRVFRSQIGLSPHEYQARRRLHHAQCLLRRGTPIAEAAAEAGFVDQSHLNRLLKQYLGITPGQYLRLQESPRHA